MSTARNPVTRIAWLVGDRAINEFETPMLRAMGFEVYQTPHAPLDRGPEGDRIIDASAQPTTLTADERMALDAHDFYEHEMTPAVARILNARFDAVVCSCYGDAIREILSQYRGRFIIRATAAERRGAACYGDALRRSGEASFVNLFRGASHRVWFAPIDDVLPEKEDIFLRSRFIRLPTGIPDRAAQQIHAWVREHDRVLVFNLDSKSPNRKSNTKPLLEELLGDIPAVLAGRRPKAENDGCAAAFLPANVLERWPWSFGENAASSADFRSYPHHPFEAILRGMPTVYMRDAYVDRLGAADLPGACTTLREARQKLQRVLNGDRQLIELLRGTQSVFFSTVNPGTTRAVWSRDFADGIMTTPIEAPPESRALEQAIRERRLAVILPEILGGTKLRTAIDLIKMLKFGSPLRDPAIDIVVAAPAQLDEALADIKAIGVQVRPLRWKTIRSEAKCIADLISSGIAMKVEHEVYAQPVDDGNDLLDCDSWLVVGDGVPHPLLPIRPYGALLFDYAQRYVSELFNERQMAHQATTSIPFAREAKYVLVTTPSAFADVNAFAGVPRRRIRQTPLFFELPHECAASPLWAEGYFVWQLDADFNNLERVVTGLARFFALEEGRLRGVVIAPSDLPRIPAPIESSQKGRAFAEETPGGDEDQDQVDESPRMTAEAIQSAIDKHPPLRTRLKVIAEVSAAEQVRILKHAKFLLHGDAHGAGSVSVVDAASLGVPSLAARYPAMEFLDESCGLNLAFFDPRDPLDLVRALEAMNMQGQRARLPDRAFLEAFHWKNAARVVCDIVLPHVASVPTAAYR